MLGGSTAVEHLPRKLKIKGSSRTSTTCTRRVRLAENANVMIKSFTLPYFLFQIF